MMAFKDSKDGYYQVDSDVVPEWATDMTPVPVVPTDNSQAEINAVNLDYLASTDWYASRKSDTGEAIPDDIVALRVAAREAIG